MPTRTDLTKIDVTEHLMRDAYGDLGPLALRFPLPAALYADAAKLVLAVVGADGKVSKAEREAWQASFRFWGASPQQVSEIAGFEPSSTPVEKLVTGNVRTMSRILLWDGIRIARTDGFGDKERAASVRVAKAIGLDASLVNTIIGLQDVEASVRESRLDLIQAPPDLSRAGSGPQIQERAEARLVEYGSDPRSPMPRDFLVNMGKAILTVAAGDGDLSENELRWFLGQAKTIGTPDDVIEEFVKFDAVGARLDAFLTPGVKPYARGILFDAIRCASQDGYHDEERALAQRAAKSLGLDPTFVVALENQIRIEASLRSARWQVLVRPIG